MVEQRKGVADRPFRGPHDGAQAARGTDGGQTGHTGAHDEHTLRAAGAGPDLSQPSEILRAPGRSIRAGGRTSLGGSYARTLTFGDDDITRHRVQSVSASGLVGSATAGLMRDATFDINGIGLSPLLRPALATTLAAAAPVLDQLLDSTLRTLGIRVGLAEVGVDGTRCDQAVLVQ